MTLPFPTAIHYCKHYRQKLNVVLLHRQVHISRRVDPTLIIDNSLTRDTGKKTHCLYLKTGCHVCSTSNTEPFLGLNNMIIIIMQIVVIMCVDSLSGHLNLILSAKSFSLNHACNPTSALKLASGLVWPGYLIECTFTSCTRTKRYVTGVTMRIMVGCYFVSSIPLSFYVS